MNDQRRPSMRAMGMIRFLAVAATLASCSTENPAAQAELFENASLTPSVKVIFAAKCVECHSPDSSNTRAKRARKFWPDARSTKELFAKNLVVPGSLEKSDLWQAVTNPDPDFRMPPPSAKAGPLTKEEIDTIRRWIENR